MLAAWRMACTTAFVTTTSVLALFVSVAPREGSGVSSYAGAIGVIEGSFKIGDGGGGAEYRIPLRVPPGTGGQQPDISLLYDSTSGNGPLGMGWQLTGFSEIERCPATLAQDGFKGAVRYDERDRYCLDGVRLIAIQGQEGKPGTQYRTETESWQRIVAQGQAGAGPEIFVVTRKDGTIAEYGAGIRAVGRMSIRAWPVTKITDTRGNTISFRYRYDPQTGEHNPEAISYTGNVGLKASRWVEFFYKPRTDVITSYTAGSVLRQAVLLDKVQTSVSGSPVKTYRLTYEVGASTGRSRLISVTEVGADDNALPATTFRWQDNASPVFKAPVKQPPTHHAWSNRVLPLDFDGDGRTDLLQALSEKEKVRFVLFRSDGGGGYLPPQGKLLPPTGQDWGGEFLTMDVNADSRVDLVYASRHDSKLILRVFLSSGDSFQLPNGEAAPDTGLPAGGTLLPAEISGDGRADLFYAIQGEAGLRIFAFRSDGKTLRLVNLNPPPPGTPWGGKLLRVDSDGDGLTDLVYATQDKSGLVLTLFRSDGQGSFTPPTGTRLPATGLPYGGQLIPEDANGDRRTDLIYALNGESGLSLLTFLNTGNGFKMITPVKSSLPYNGLLIPSDVNGDGMVDLAVGVRNESTLGLHVFLSNGMAFNPPTGNLLAGQQVAWGSLVLPVDLDGDGLTDLSFVSQEDAGLRLTTSLRSSGYPDLICEITDGLGERIEVQYRPLTDPNTHSPKPIDSAAGVLDDPSSVGAESVVGRISGAVYPFSSSAPLAQGTLGATFPDLDVRFPAYVVAEYTERDGIGNSYATKLRYFGGRVNLLGRGWLGFQAEEWTDPAQNRTSLSTYEQQFPLVGLRKSTRTLRASDRMILRETAFEHTFSVSHKVYLPLKTAEVEKNYHEGSLQFTQRKEFQYDAYGNRTLESDLGRVAGSPPHGPNRPLYLHTTYLNDEISWRIGFPTETSTTADAAGKEVLKRQRTKYNSGTMTVSVREDWDSASNSWLQRSYQYDPFGNLLQSKSPAGDIIDYEYEPAYKTFLSRQISPKNAQGIRSAETFAYDPRFGVLVTETDANGRAQGKVLDGLGRVTAETVPGPAGQPVEWVRYSWIAEGPSVVFETRRRLDWKGEHWSWTREVKDGLGRTVKTLSLGPDGIRTVVVSKKLDREGRTLRESLPAYQGEADLVVTQEFDPLGRLIRKVQPRPDGGATVTTLTYPTGDGRVTTVTESPAGGVPWTTSRSTLYAYYRGELRPVSETDEDGKSTTFSYDALGRLISVRDPQGGVNQVSYSSTDVQTSLSETNTGKRTFRYDLPGRMATETHEASAQTTTLKFDALGRVIEKRLADGAVTIFQYDLSGEAHPNSIGRLSKVLLPGGSASYDYGYDRAGRLSSIKLILGGQTYIQRREYGPNGQILRSVYPDGSVLHYQYSDGEHLSRLALAPHATAPAVPYANFSKHYPNGAPGTTTYGNSVEGHYSYTGNGRLREFRLESKGNQWVHQRISWFNQDQIGGIEDLTPGGEATQTFTYDRVARLTVAKGPYGHLTYAYGADGNLTAKEGVSFEYEGQRLTIGKQNGHTVVEGFYDSKGNLRKKTTPEGTLELTYDPEERLTTVKGKAGVLDTFTYDHTGRRLTKSDTVDGTTTYYVADDYEVTRFSSGKILHTRYIHGPMGVIATITVPENEVLRWLDHNEEAFLASQADPRTLSGALVRAWHRAAQALARPDPSRWLAQFVLTAFSLAGSLVWAVAHLRQPAPRRLHLARSPVWPVLVVALLFCPFGCEAVAAEGPVATGVPSSGILYFHQDQAGSVCLTSDPQGMLKTRVRYKPYGALFDVTGPDNFRPHYSGKERDTGSGFYYFGARYYDADLGRFLTPDNQLGGSFDQAHAFNRYAYCLGDPINRVDPSGHAGLSLILVPFLNILMTFARIIIDEIFKIFPHIMPYIFHIGAFVNSYTERIERFPDAVTAYLSGFLNRVLVESPERRLLEQIYRVVENSRATWTRAEELTRSAAPAAMPVSVASSGPPSNRNLAQQRQSIHTAFTFGAGSLETAGQRLFAPK